MSCKVFIWLVIITFTGYVDSKYLGLPDPVKFFTVASDCLFYSQESCAEVKWSAYETDTTSYNIEFVGVHDGKSIVKNLNASWRSYMTFHYDYEIDGLKLNETYTVRIFAVNERGQSPPSPEVIFHLDPYQIDYYRTCSFTPDRDSCKQFGSRLLPPQNPEVKLITENRLNITWYDVRFRKNLTWVENPVEYIIRYGNNKNTSLWNTLKTHNTWITLDDLKNGKEYSGYVTARENNLTSAIPFFFPIRLDEDLTGLPEPVITIEPAHKNEVFAPGDPMTIRCTLPPNTNTKAAVISMFVGKREVSDKQTTFLTMNTTASEDVDNAECRLSIWHNERSSCRIWEVKKPLDDKLKLI